ncbi:hypothetical protein JK363_08855 [Streptomyces sp. 205]|uniref:Uncharacterized protein n=1 Tax=Streptomyces coffeae TaxID=621382 RepID=A0ABS1N9L2_9ACTN|nr:hypothetical protein [Streptomyces coffeae]
MVISTSRQCWRRTPTSGVFSAASGCRPASAFFRASAFRASARANAAWKTGDSSTERRIHKPTSTSTPDSRNGTRQPQDSNADANPWTSRSAVTSTGAAEPTATP